MTAMVLTAGKRYLGIVVAGVCGLQSLAGLRQSFERDELELELERSLNASLTAGPTGPLTSSGPSALSS